MAARFNPRLPRDLLEIIDGKVKRGEIESREAFIETAVRRYASEIMLEELQRKHGVPGSMTPSEEKRVVRMIRAMRH